MKKTINIALLLLMLCAAASLMGGHSDDFVLGAFSENAPGDGLVNLNSSSFRGLYGYSVLATGVYQKFEAEYASAEAVQPGEEDLPQFCYQSRDRVGHFIYDLSFSNQTYWHVPPGTRGYAYQDLFHRWPEADGTLRRIGPEFRFLRTWNSAGKEIDAENCLYVRFIFKATDLDKLADNDTLATFSFTCSDATSTNADYQAVWFYHGKDDPSLAAKSLTKAEYLDLPIAHAANDPSMKCVEFRFPFGNLNSTDICSLFGQGVVKATAWYWQLKNLNPRMWWHGRGSLMLDYVEFSDKVYNEFTNDPNERARLRNFNPEDDYFVENLSHHFGIDEPKHPHYQAYTILEEHLRAMGGKELLTASSFEKRQVAKPDGTPLRLTQAYIDEVNPRALMINRYPLTNEHVWWNWGNAVNLNDYGFVQKKIEKTVLNEYDYYRNIASARSMKFIAMPQISGEWNPEGNKWEFILPPGKLAKCLQLLPLCYKPDGIVPFKFDIKEDNQDNQYAMVKQIKKMILFNQ
ncbi:MAG: hypothetical protein K0B87_02580 [Candidatus Syntrophosphaera sp.]|nr:hypothetical protein [Candidatus Syntrophosphaera sp.]